MLIGYGTAVLRSTLADARPTGFELGLLQSWSSWMRLLYVARGDNPLTITKTEDPMHLVEDG